MNYLEAFLFVVFGMIAGGPIWLLFLASRPTKRWWVIDSTCQKIEDKGT